jgi:hypothetical protein
MNFTRACRFWVMLYILSDLSDLSALRLVLVFWTHMRLEVDRTDSMGVKEEVASMDCRPHFSLQVNVILLLQPAS